MSPRCAARLPVAVVIPAYGVPTAMSCISGSDEAALRPIRFRDGADASIEARAERLPKTQKPGNATEALPGCKLPLLGSNQDSPDPESGDWRYPETPAD